MKRNPKDLFKPPMQPRIKVIAHETFDKSKEVITQRIEKSLYISNQLKQIDSNKLYRKMTYLF